MIGLGIIVFATTIARAGSHALTATRPSSILEGVVTLSRRASVLALTMAFVVGNAGLCAGWAATPEARMACCVGSAQCPMHGSGSPESDTHHPVSQAQADSCCAGSESHSSGSSAPTSAVILSAPVLGPAILLPPDTPALTLREPWRSVLSGRGDPVPKYVLLSVFLV